MFRAYLIWYFKLTSLVSLSLASVQETLWWRDMAQEYDNPSCPANSVLPYRDIKPTGAAGFYLGINATFRFIQDTYGSQALRQYWQDLGNRYFAPVSRLWSRRGLAGVADYWREFFTAEPGAEAVVTLASDHVIVNVKSCPAISHLRHCQREIMPDFCEHCYWVSSAIGRSSDISVVVKGGDGACVQEFFRSGSGRAQNLEDIARCT